MANLHTGSAIHDKVHIFEWIRSVRVDRAASPISPTSRASRRQADSLVWFFE